jgi:3-phenylpropionate/cinnamic acid dioxygenase small subunit
MNPNLVEELRQFVQHEVELLDAGRYDDWLALYAEEGHYWMPLVPDQQDARLHGSLMYEDTLLLKVRIERLKGARTFSQQPGSRCHHLIQSPTVQSINEVDGSYRVRHAFHYVEARQSEQQLYAGWATHDLVRRDGKLKILLKRVDLINCDAALPNIQLFM